MARVQLGLIVDGSLLELSDNEEDEDYMDHMDDIENTYDTDDIYCYDTDMDDSSLSKKNCTHHR